MNIFKKALLIALSAGLLSVPSTLDKVETVEAASETRTIYLNPSSNWKEANAHFEAWAWGGSSADAWYDFTDNDSDGYYEISIPTDRTGMKVVRKAPGQTHNWTNWAESGDITISSSNNCLSNSGWNTSFTWSTYTPAVQVTGDEKHVLAGAFGADGDATWWNSDWETGFQLKHSELNQRYEHTRYIEKGTQFKIVSNGTWKDYTFGSDEAHKYTSNAGGNDSNFETKYTGTYTFYILDEDARGNNAPQLFIEFNGHLQFYVQKATDNSASVRLLATFGDAVNNKDIALYDEVGLEITFEGQTVSVDAGYIYDSVVADGTTYTANDYGAQHFFCITLRNVPNNAEFTVTPYARLSDSTVERGSTYTYTFTA